MALSFPIISDFDGRGVRKALKSFKQMESTSEKASGAMKLAWAGAAAGVAALGAAAFEAGKTLLSFADMAAEDQKSSKQLEIVLKATTKATDAQVKSVEAYIDKTQRSVGVTDDQLRPALGRLLRSTKDTEEAQKLLNLALDISATTGKPLEAVTNALGKAYDGSAGALGRLGLGLDKAQLKSMSFSEIVAYLTNKFNGGAAQAVDTYEGKMRLLRIRVDELKERIGYALLQALSDLADAGSRISDAFDKEGAAGALQQFRFELGYLSEQANFSWLESMYNGIQKIYNGLSKVLKLSSFIAGVPLFNKVLKLFGKDQLPTDLGSLPDWKDITNVAPVISPYAPKSPSPMDLPGMATGGIVTKPTLAVIGEAGPEAVIPLSQAGAGIGGNTVVVHVAGSVVAERDLVQSVYNGLLKLQKRQGALGFVA